MLDFFSDSHAMEPLGRMGPGRRVPNGPNSHFRQIH